MKETVAEYSRVIIACICFALIISFIFGGSWLKRMGQSLGAVQNDVVQTRQQSVLDELDDKYPPTIVVSGNTFKTGTLIELTKSPVFTRAYSEEIDTNIKKQTDLSDRIKVFCNSSDFNKEANTLIPQSPGLYEVEYSVTDDYGQTTRKIINIIAEL